MEILFENFGVVFLSFFKELIFEKWIIKSYEN